MITIAEQHYQKMLELVRSLNKNMVFLHPSSQELASLFSQWKSINESLQQLYRKLQRSLHEIVSKNSEITNENHELNNKLLIERAQNNSLSQSIVIQRAELAKNQSQLMKYKEGVKKLKDSHKEKLLLKDQLIEQLQKKVRKYKKISEQQEKKFEKLDKKITEYEITQRSEMKQKELDDQLLELEQMCKDLNEEPQQFDGEDGVQ